MHADLMASMHQKKRRQAWRRQRILGGKLNEVRSSEHCPCPKQSRARHTHLPAAARVPGLVSVGRRCAKSALARRRSSPSEAPCPPAHRCASSRRPPNHPWTRSPQIRGEPNTMTVAAMEPLKQHKFAGDVVAWFSNVRQERRACGRPAPERAAGGRAGGRWSGGRRQAGDPAARAR